MDEETKRKIVEEAVRRGAEGRSSLSGMVSRLQDELDSKLREAGLPDDLVELLRYRRELRARLAPSRYARALFPVQQMPEGAVPVYFKKDDD